MALLPALAALAICFRTDSQYTSSTHWHRLVCCQNIKKEKLPREKTWALPFSFIFISPSVTPYVTCPPLHKLCKMRQSSVQKKKKKTHRDKQMLCEALAGATLMLASTVKVWLVINNYRFLPPHSWTRYTMFYLIILWMRCIQ